MISSYDGPYILYTLYIFLQREKQNFEITKDWKFPAQIGRLNQLYNTQLTHPSLSSVWDKSPVHQHRPQGKKPPYKSDTGPGLETISFVTDQEQPASGMWSWSQTYPLSQRQVPHTTSPTTQGVLQRSRHLVSLSAWTLKPHCE